MEELQKTLQATLNNLLGDLECAICLDLIKDPVTTTCCHHFCKKCITHVLQNNRHAACPLCKTFITKRNISVNKKLINIVHAATKIVMAIKEDCGITVLLSPTREPLADLRGNCNNKTTEILMKKNEKEKNIKNRRQSKQAAVPVRICETELNDNKVLTSVNQNVTNININSGFPSPKKNKSTPRTARTNRNLKNSRTSLTYDATIENLSPPKPKEDIANNPITACTSFNINSNLENTGSKPGLGTQLVDYIRFGLLKDQKDIKEIEDVALTSSNPSETSLCSITQQINKNNINNISVCKNSPLVSNLFSGTESTLPVKEKIGQWLATNCSSEVSNTKVDELVWSEDEERTMFEKKTSGENKSMHSVTCELLSTYEVECSNLQKKEEQTSVNKSDALMDTETDIFSKATENSPERNQIKKKQMLDTSILDENKILRNLRSKTKQHPSKEDCMLIQEDDCIVEPDPYRFLGSQSSESVTESNDEVEFKQNEDFPVEIKSNKEVNDKILQRNFWSSDNETIKNSASENEDDIGLDMLFVTPQGWNMSHVNKKGSSKHYTRKRSNDSATKYNKENDVSDDVISAGVDKKSKETNSKIGRKRKAKKNTKVNNEELEHLKSKIEDAEAHDLYVSQGKSSFHLGIPDVIEIADVPTSDIETPKKIKENRNASKLDSTAIPKKNNEVDSQMEATIESRMLNDLKTSEEDNKAIISNKISEQKSPPPRPIRKCRGKFKNSDISSPLEHISSPGWSHQKQMANDFQKKRKRLLEAATIEYEPTIVSVQPCCSSPTSDEYAVSPFSSTSEEKFPQKEITDDDKNKKLDSLKCNNEKPKIDEVLQSHKTGCSEETAVATYSRRRSLRSFSKKLTKVNMPIEENKNLALNVNNCHSDCLPKNEICSDQTLIKSSNKTDSLFPMTNSPSSEKANTSPQGENKMEEISIHLKHLSSIVQESSMETSPVKKQSTVTSPNHHFQYECCSLVKEDQCRESDGGSCPEDNNENVLDFSKNETVTKSEIREAPQLMINKAGAENSLNDCQKEISAVNTLHNKIISSELNDNEDDCKASKTYPYFIKNVNNIQTEDLYKDCNNPREEELTEDTEPCIQLYSTKRSKRKTFALDADTEDLNLLIKTKENLIEFSEGILQGPLSEIEAKTSDYLNSSICDASHLNLNLPSVKKSPNRQSSNDSFQLTNPDTCLEKSINQTVSNQTTVNESKDCNSGKKHRSQKEWKSSPETYSKEEIISNEENMNKTPELVKENKRCESRSANDPTNDSIQNVGLSSNHEFDIKAVHNNHDTDLKCSVKFYFCTTLVPKHLNIRSIGVQVEEPSDSRHVSLCCSKAVQTDSQQFDFSNDVYDLKEKNSSVDNPCHIEFPKPDDSDFNGNKELNETNPQPITNLSISISPKNSDSSCSDTYPAGTKDENSSDSSLIAHFCLKCKFGSNCTCESHNKQSFKLASKTETESNGKLENNKDCEHISDKTEDSLSFFDKGSSTNILFLDKEIIENHSNKFRENSEPLLSPRISQNISSECKSIILPSNETGEYSVNMNSHLKSSSSQMTLKNLEKTPSESDSSSFTGQSISLLQSVQSMRSEEAKEDKNLNTDKDLEQQNRNKSSEKRKSPDQVSEDNSKFISDDNPNKAKRRRTVRGLASKLSTSVLNTPSNLERSHYIHHSRSRDEDSDATDNRNDVDIELVPPTPPRHCVGSLSKSLLLPSLESTPTNLHFKRDTTGKEKLKESSVMEDNIECIVQNSRDFKTQEENMVIPESLTHSYKTESTKKKFKRIKSWSDDSSDDELVSKRKLSKCSLENSAKIHDESGEFISDSEKTVEALNMLFQTDEGTSHLMKKPMSSKKKVPSNMIGKLVNNKHDGAVVSNHYNNSNNEDLKNTDVSPPQDLSKVLSNFEADMLLYKQFNNGKSPEIGINEGSMVNEDDSVVLLDRSSAQKEDDSVVILDRSSAQKEDDIEREQIKKNQVTSNTDAVQVKFQGISNKGIVHSKIESENKENDSNITVSQLTVDESMKLDDKDNEIGNQSISSLMNEMHEMSCTLSTQTDVGNTQQREELKRDIDRIQQDMKMLLEKLKTKTKSKTDLEDICPPADEKGDSFVYPFESSDYLLSDNREKVITEDKENSLHEVSKTHFNSDLMEDKEEKKSKHRINSGRIQQNQNPNRLLYDPWEDDRKKRGKLSFVVTGINKRKMLIVKEFAKHLKADLQLGFSLQTTHVIVEADEDLKCERTFKYFQGIAGKKWVVGFQWVTDSLKANHLLPEEDFEVTSDTAIGTHNGPRLSRLSQLPLFGAYEICCLGSFPRMNREQFLDLIEMCGATTVFEPSMYNYPPNKKQIILADEHCELRKNFPEYFRKYRAITLSWHWALDSISCFQCLPFRQYLLCNPTKTRLHF